MCCSIERNVIITANDTAEPPTVSPPSAPLHQNKTWPTPSGINETEARRICQSPILQSPVFSLCQNFTVDSLEFISESCMLDLLVYILYYYYFKIIFFATMVCNWWWWWLFDLLGWGWTPGLCSSAIK